MNRPRLGVDSYTLRALQWDAIQLLDYAATVGLDCVQFSELPHIARPMEKATDEGFLRQVRAYAERLGIRLEMGTWGVCPTSRAFNPKRGGTAPEQLGLAIRVAAILGATTVRCVVGNEVERKENGPIEKHIDAMIAVCRAVRDQALRAGVKIAIENHKDLRAEEMRYLVEQAGPDYVGVCLDTGNPILVLEDPLETVEILAPYALTTPFATPPSGNTRAAPLFSGWPWVRATWELTPWSASSRGAARTSRLTWKLSPGARRRF